MLMSPKKPAVSRRRLLLTAGGRIDYYSGIENVAIFNAVIYRRRAGMPSLPTTYCHVELGKLSARPGGVART